MSNPLRQLVKDIQYKTDLTLDQIADKAGIGRAYFRNEVSKGTSKSILRKLQTNFKEIIEQNASRETIINEPQNGYQTKNPNSTLGPQAEVPLLQNRLTDKDEIIRLQNMIIAMQSKENQSLQSEIDALKQITTGIDEKVSKCNQLMSENNLLTTEVKTFLKSLEGLSELAKVARSQDPDEQPRPAYVKRERKQDGKSKSAAGK